MNKKKLGFLFLVIAALMLGVFVFSKGPIAQDPAYNSYADKQTILGIPNFWNVVSNLPFLLFGLYGLSIKDPNVPKNKAYWLFYLSTIPTSLGSAYYHLNPTNQSLVWDRWPMAIGFGALCSLLIQEFVSVEWGKKILFPIVGVSMLSLLFWLYTDDLRPYLFTQFYLMAAAPLVLFFFDSKKSKQGYWLMLSFYVFAKAFESYDKEVYTSLCNLHSGHSLKHLFAALGLGVLTKNFKRIERY